MKKENISFLTIVGIGIITVLVFASVVIFSPRAKTDSGSQATASTTSNIASSYLYYVSYATNQGSGSMNIGTETKIKTLSDITNVAAFIEGKIGNKQPVTIIDYHLLEQ